MHARLDDDLEKQLRTQRPRTRDEAQGALKKIVQSDVLYNYYEASKVIQLDCITEDVDQLDGLQKEVFRAFLRKLHEQVKWS